MFDTIDDNFESALDLIKATGCIILMAVIGVVFIALIAVMICVLCVLALALCVGMWNLSLIFSSGLEAGLKSNASDIAGWFVVVALSLAGLLYYTRRIPRDIANSIDKACFKH